MKNALATILAGLLGTASAFCSASELAYVGANLSGAEFGDVIADGGAAFPGANGIQYTYPTLADIIYFQSKGMNTIRLPFRWERLQRTNRDTLDATELNNMNSFVSQATQRGMYVILDPHNYARYYPDQSTDGSLQSGTAGIIGGSSVSVADFRDLWSRLAAIYKTNNYVIFALMNEPNAIASDEWLLAANQAISGIRSAGATNLILVPGIAYTGAWSWSSNFYGTPNSQQMLNIVDPANNYAYEVHQYFDNDSSGNSSQIMSNTVGIARLSDFTSWLKTNHRRGFLGEFAVANSTIGASGGYLGDQTLTNTLRYIETNSDVWIGWTWWSAGPWWGDYRFTLEPQNIGQPNQTDQPAMQVLKNLIPIPIPELVISSPTQFQFMTRQGFIYQPEASSNLISSPWVDNAPSFTGDGQLHTLNMNGNSSPEGYYRLRVTRAP
jgi:endoglucanase